MRSNKGFTLIELLAVLVILGIVAIITTPIILGVVDDARRDGAVDSAWGTVDAIKLSYTQGEFENVAAGNNIADLIEDGNVRISGDRPTAGTFTINEQTGEIRIQGFVFGDFTCSHDEDDVTRIECE